MTSQLIDLAETFGQLLNNDELDKNLVNQFNESIMTQMLNFLYDTGLGMKSKNHWSNSPLEITAMIVDKLDDWSDVKKVIKLNKKSEKTVLKYSNLDKYANKMNYKLKSCPYVSSRKMEINPIYMDILSVIGDFPDLLECFASTNYISDKDKLRSLCYYIHLYGITDCRRFYKSFELICDSYSDEQTYMKLCCDFLWDGKMEMNSSEMYYRKRLIFIILKKAQKMIKDTNINEWLKTIMKRSGYAVNLFLAHATEQQLESSLQLWCPLIPPPNPLDK